MLIKQWHAYKGGYFAKAGKLQWIIVHLKRKGLHEIKIRKSDTEWKVAGSAPSSELAMLLAEQIAQRMHGKTLKGVKNERATKKRSQKKNARIPGRAV